MFMLHLVATELGVPSQVTKHDIVRWLAGRPPRLHAHSRQPFRKVGTRSAQAIAKIVVAGVWEKQPRLAIGSVAPIPLRLSATGEALGRGATVAEAEEILQREIAPIDDLRSTAEYRRQVAANLLRQFWNESR
jgi:CO/xanthine dehydrogenase FAD-binding subunit